MIVIYGMLLVFFLIFAYSIFQNILSYSQHQTTQYLIVWFFSLLIINLFLMISMYSYHYYKTNMNPYQGRPGLPGYQGLEGPKGANTLECRQLPEF